MKKTKMKFLIVIGALTLVMGTNVYAQASEDEGPEPPPTTPINQSIPLLMLVGVGIAYYAFTKTNIRVKQ